MRSSRIETLNRMLLEAFPALDDEKRRIALATYRAIATGEAASPATIAAAAAVPAGRVREVLDEWIGVYRDDAGRVVGFWGLAIPKMKHRFEVDGVGLHTWCAWDTLFLPELLGKTARVESACETTGERVRLTVSPAGVERVEPAAPVVSFLEPDAEGFRSDVIATFCHYIHFFRTREAGEAWTAKNPRTFLLGLGEAVELARWKNESQFGELLPRAATEASG